MSGLDIEAIRHRYGKVEQLRGEESPSTPRIVVVLARAADDVPVLLAQIERERAALAEALKTVREQAAEIERLRAAADSALTAAYAEINRMRAELNDARFGLTGERDDALQMITDLRGEAP